MTPFVIVLLLLLPLGTAPASPAGDLFDDADANGDAVLTFDELTSVLPQATPEEFAAVDLNADGKLNYDEFELGLDEGYFERR